MSNLMSSIFILAAIAITFGYTNGAYRSMDGSSVLEEKSVVELQAEKARYESALDKAREIEEVRNGLLTRYNSIPKADLERLNKLMPDSIDTIRMIVDISSLAASYNLTFKDITIAESGSSSEVSNAPVSADIYSYVVLGFNVSGPYETLLAFLTDLEKSLRVVDIAKVGLTGGGKTQGNYTINVSLKAFYLI